MATVYVSSLDGDNADTGADWANAKETVAGALAVAADATNVIYVDSAHSYSAAGAITWNAATQYSHVAIVCVNRATGVWTTGAKEDTGANAAAFSVCTTHSQSLYVYGVELAVNSGSSGTNYIALGAQASLAYQETPGYHITMESCTFRMPGTSAEATLHLGHATANRAFPKILLLKPHVIIKSSTTAGFPAIYTRYASVDIFGMTIEYSGANKPPALLGGSNYTSIGRAVRVADSDLSAFEGALVDVTKTLAAHFEFRNCKLHANASAVTGTWQDNDGSVTRINCDSGDTKNVIEHYNLYGTLLESGTIYADDGAAFFKTGGGRVSWQIVTSASCREGNPYISPWIVAPHDGVAEIDLTLELNHDSATDLTNRNCWMEIEYVSNALFPQGTLASTRNAQPFDGAAVDLTASAIAWTGTGGWGDENKQKITHRFTPAQAGLIRARLCVGVASKTLYLDPQLRIAAV